MIPEFEKKYNTNLLDEAISYNELAGFNAAQGGQSTSTWQSTGAPEKENWTPTASGLGHLGLGIAGMVPGYGIPFDVADAGWYAAEGDKLGAGLSTASAAAGLGLGANIAALPRKVARAVTDLFKTSAKGKSLLKHTKLIDELAPISRQAGDVPTRSIYIGDPNIPRVTIGDTGELSRTVARGIENIYKNKTGPEAYARFKFTFPDLKHMFKNVDEFDAYVKANIKDTASKMNFYDVPQFATKAGGWLPAVGAHIPAPWAPDAVKGVKDITKISGSTHIAVGRSMDDIAETIVHEGSHAVNWPFYQASFRGDPVLQSIEAQLKKGSTGFRPMQLQAGRYLDSPAGRRIQELLKPFRRGIDELPHISEVSAPYSRSRWRDRHGYMGQVDEVLARANQSRTMPGMGKFSSVADLGHPYGRAGEDINRYYKGLTESDIWDKLYGVAPIGAYGAYKGQGLLDYTTQQQGE